MNRPTIVVDSASFKFMRDKRFVWQTCKNPPFNSACNRGLVLSVFNGEVRYALTGTHCDKLVQRQKAVEAKKAAAQRERDESKKKQENAKKSKN